MSGSKISDLTTKASFLGLVCDDDECNSKSVNRKMLKKLTIAYFCWLVFIVVGADLGLLTPLMSWLHSMPYGDKGCHFLFVGIFCFLLSASLAATQQRMSRRRAAVLGTIVLVAAVTSLEELSQSMLRHRQYSELDMLCNIAGTCVFGGLAMLITPYLTQSQADIPRT